MNGMMEIHGTYNPLLVLLSVVVAVATSYAVLALAWRINNRSLMSRRQWLMVGASIMGTGIWSMHFIGMLAFSLPVPMAYDVPITLVSLVIAATASGFGLTMISRRHVTWSRLLTGGFFMGLAIAGMHYTGMAAMRMPVLIRYNRPLLVLSIVIAVVAATVALWLAVQLRTDRGRYWRLFKYGSAMLMGFAIAGMHYTGMAAAIFEATSMPEAIPAAAIGSAFIALIITLAVFLVLCGGLFMSLVDMRLTEQSERLAIIGNNLVDGLITITELGVVETFNPAAERIFGYQAAEVIGNNITMLQPEPYHSEHDGYLHNYVTTGIKKIIGIGREVQGLRKDGTTFPMELSVSESRLANKRIFTGMVRDISERKAAEAVLREREAKLSAIVTTAVDGIITITDRGIVETFNPAAEKIFGYKADEVVGNNITMLQPEPYHSEHDGYLRNYFTTGIKKIIGIGREVKGLRKDSTIFPMELSVSESQLGDKRFFTGIVRDVTERVRINSELRTKNEELLRRAIYDTAYAEINSLFASILDKKILLDRTLSKLADSLPFPCSAFYEYDEWQGKIILVAGHGLPAGQTLEFGMGEGLVGQALADGRSIVLTGSDDFPLQFETGLGPIRPAAIVVQPISYQEKKTGVLVLAATESLGKMIQDFLGRLSDQLGIVLQNLKQYSDLKDLSDQLSERSQEISMKNKALQDANRLKSDFLANMSHELRTPLNAIIGFSEILKDGVMGELNVEQQDYITDIFTSGEHLLSLINDILDLSKIEAGKMQLDLEEVHIPSMLENSFSIIKEKAMVHNIGLELEIDDAVSTCQLDPRKFKQVVFNLLSNAVKFSENGGRVTMRAWQETGGKGADLLVSVADTGIGMSEEDIQQLFQAFVQLDGSTSRKFEGTGLGLVMVKRLVELHGGTVSVTSREGEGSCFTVRLPARVPAEEASVPGNSGLVKSRPPAAAGQGEVAPPEGNPLVLVIEDDPKAATLYRSQLEASGYRTAHAGDAIKGLELARAIRPDLITLDIMMPGMSGWEFLEKVKEEPVLADIPVVIVSMVADEAKGFSLGARKVLAKPVKKNDLLRALGEIKFQKKSRPEECKILVVDDDPKAVELVSRHLASSGYGVLKAYGGREAISLVMAETVDLVVLDLMMPEVTGFDVVRAMRDDERSRMIPIVILTAKILTKENYLALDNELVQVVAKSSLSGTDFISEIHRALTGDRKKVPAVASSPVSPYFPAVNRKRPIADKDGRQQLVLVVEDSQAEADLLKLHLEDEGFRVKHAANGSQGMEMMIAERPDLVTLDLLMPEMDGFAFMEKKGSHPDFADIPVVIISANTDDARVTSLGARAVLGKPIRRQSLLAIVNSILVLAQREGKATILLIDDDPKAIKIIASFFPAEQYKILYSYNGSAGLSLAREETPDLILLDLMMPEMNGFEVLLRLKEEEATRDIPVVILTAKILSGEERRQLSEQAVLIAAKGTQIKNNLIADIKQMLG